MFFADFGTAFLNILVWWAVLLVFQRVSNRYPERNTWKKDFIITLIQSVVVVLILVPILSYFQ